ncbi:hemolysin family protein [Tahibacter amnicola]|uniref:Hemolysin family protein n=1 Tax=Tahibacter amnicola TaxID=2976241 RepID=A0ABY6BB18_9GAMM|nr:hemolysin family protein [Tahibacter amnicola]UXI67253.1 hemolysin family protein [Tahibacter amnicola]
MLTEILVVFVLILFNGFFALSEMSVVTARKSRLKQMAETSTRATNALRLTESPERFLSTVQVGITLISLLTGVYGGATIGARISAGFAGMGVEPDVSAFLGTALSVAAITYVSIIVGELIPKRAALVAPEKIAVWIAFPMRLFATVAAPFVWLLSYSTRIVLTLLRLNRGSRDPVTEEEIRLLVAESAEQGVIDSDEHNMVNRVLRLGDRSVASLMTPRTRIAWLDVAAPLAANLAVMRDTPYSRYPVYRGNEQDVVGVLEIKSLLDTLGTPNVDLFGHLRKALFVPSTARALDLLEELRESEATVALVVDEYGDIEGLVSLNDILGAVMGKTALVTEAVSDAPIVKREDGSYLVDGALGTDDLRELLDLRQLPNEEDHDFRTAAGMVMAQFGRIPQVGESFRWRGFRFEVLDLDGPRIDKLLIARTDAPQLPDADAAA